ncbi:MAG: ribosome biogenesis GTPase Der [Candidatus Dasytiphilus stammeri]
MIPIITLVGRPNVGKSTLFNRLTGMTNVVADIPNLTRDRHYSNIRIQGQMFVLVDTGGIDKINKRFPEDQLYPKIFEQLIQAIEESHLVLLIVDAHGIMPGDIYLSQIIKSKKKNLFIVVNKIDSFTYQNYIGHEFYTLGLELHLISSSQGIGINQLTKKIFLWYKNHQNIFNQYYGNQINHDSDKSVNINESIIKFAIVGRPNVGKSTLTNRLLGERRVIVFNQPGTTRDSIFIPIEWKGIKYTLIDTAGIKKIYKSNNYIEKIFLIKTKHTIQKTNVVVMVLDAYLGINLQDSLLVNFITKSGRGIILVVNKWDLLSSTEKHKFKEKLLSRREFMKIFRIHFISCLSSLDKEINLILDSIKKVYYCTVQHISSSVLSKILQNAIQQHKPPTIRGYSVKMKYAHLGGHNPFIIVIHGNRLHKIPDTYKNYLINYFSSSLKMIGMPIKLFFKESQNPFLKKNNYQK